MNKVCKCGVEIHFIAGIPCEQKKISVVCEDGKVRRGWESHFANCPHAADFRGKKTKSAVSAEERLRRRIVVTHKKYGLEKAYLRCRRNNVSRSQFLTAMESVGISNREVMHAIDQLKEDAK